MIVSAKSKLGTVSSNFSQGGRPCLQQSAQQVRLQACLRTLHLLLLLLLLLLLAMRLLLPLPTALLRREAPLQ